MAGSTCAFLTRMLTAPALARCAPKGSAQLGGNGFFFPVRAESAHGFAYITESQALPGNQETVVRQAQVEPKVFVGSVKLTGLSMALGVAPMPFSDDASSKA